MVDDEAGTVIHCGRCTGVMAEAWCLLIHGEVSISLLSLCGRCRGECMYTMQRMTLPELTGGIGSSEGLLVVGQRAGGQVEQPAGAGGVQARGDGNAGRGARHCAGVGGGDGGSDGR